MSDYQHWHDLTHNAPAQRWLREQVREVARSLGSHGLPQRAARARARPGPRGR
jgi:hypothetical protein